MRGKNRPVRSGPHFGPVGARFEGFGPAFAELLRHVEAGARRPRLAPRGDRSARSRTACHPCGPDPGVARLARLARVRHDRQLGHLGRLRRRVRLHPRRRAAQRCCLRAHWLELLIVVITPPFIPRVLSSLRAARLLRLLQVARLGLLGDQALIIERTLTSRRGFRFIAAVTALLVFVTGAVVSVVDTKDFPNVGDGVWWAIVTVTTVGYGDFVPHSVSGRIVASIVMIVGIGFISVLTATIASTFVASDHADTDSSADILAALTRIEERLERLEAGGTPSA
jgi:voltage-gated potassium channel Kch